MLNMEKFVCNHCKKEFETTSMSYKRYAGLCYSCRKLNLTHPCRVCGKECSVFNATCSKECMLRDPVRKENQKRANRAYWEAVDDNTLNFKREVAKRSFQSPEARAKANESIRKRWESATDEDRAKHGEAVSKALRSDPNLPERLHKTILTGGKVSAGQRQVFDFVKGFCSDTVLEYPLDKYLVDIFVPSKNLAIEFNGWYWHSDRANRSEITLEKYKLCKRLGIRLIVIWDFDWLQRRSIWEAKLQSILGVAGERLYARDCEFSENFNRRIKSDFLNLHHLQGDDQAFYWCGLFNDGACTAVMTFRKSRDNKSVELSRYAGEVVGGFSKLLKHCINTLRGFGCSEIISFSDNSVSDGNLYEKNGWKLVSEIGSDYRVVYNAKCYHKSSFTKANIKEKFPEVYNENLTEFQMEDLIPAYRIWDCGKKKWVFELK